MREILFRGKRIDNGEWLEGVIVVWDEEYYIAPAIINRYISMGGRGKGRRRLFGDYYHVDSSTVGQYTGLTDKNGKKIFEGDIVHYIYDSGKENGWKVDQNSIIKWDFSGFYMDGIFGSNKYACRSGWLENIVCNGGKFFEVIGNIHDNPELLEVGE